MNRKVSFEQYFGATQKYKQNNVGEVLISIATASVEEAMLVADDYMRRKSVGLTKSLRDAERAFSDQRYVDCIFFIKEVNDVLKNVVETGQHYIKDIEQQKLLAKGEKLCFIKKEASSSVIDFFKWIFDGIFGKPLEKAYDNQVSVTKGIIKSVLSVTQSAIKEIGNLFNSLKSERRNKNVEGWIKVFRDIEEVSEHLNYAFESVLDNEDIQKLFAASQGKLQTNTGNSPSENPQNVRALVSEIPAAQRAVEQIADPDKKQKPVFEPEQRWTSKYQFYINGKHVGDAAKFKAVFRMILHYALGLQSETVIETSAYGVLGKVIPNTAVELTWSVSKLPTNAPQSETPVKIEGYKVSIPFDKIKDVIKGIDNDYYNLDQSTLNRIIKSPNVNQNEEGGDEEEVISKKDIEEAPIPKEKIKPDTVSPEKPDAEAKPVRVRKTRAKPVENNQGDAPKEPIEETIKRRREEFKIPVERPIGTFGPLGICLAVKAAHTPNKEINIQRRDSVAKYFGLSGQDHVVIGKAENLVGKMLMISPYNDPNQFVVIGIEPNKQQYKKMLDEGTAMKSEAHISSLVRQLKHDRFYNLLKQASDMQDPYLMATIMAKYSKTIENSDPELSIQLLMKAKEIVDG